MRLADLRCFRRIDPVAALIKHCDIATRLGIRRQFLMMLSEMHHFAIRYNKPHVLIILNNDKAGF